MRDGFVRRRTERTRVHFRRHRLNTSPSAAPAMMSNLVVVDLKLGREDGWRSVACGDRTYSSEANLILIGARLRAGEGWLLARSYSCRANWGGVHFKWRNANA